MERKEVRAKVLGIISEQMGVDTEKINEETRLIDDLGADSLDCVELIMEFEDAFDMNIPDETAEKIQTVGEIIKYIEENQ